MYSPYYNHYTDKTQVFSLVKNDAITQLKYSDFTCVLCKGDSLHTSTLRGVKTLVLWARSCQDLRGRSAADRVVGKAAAFLYILLGVKRGHAGVISRSAQETPNAHGVNTHYDHLTENIINRQATASAPLRPQSWR